MTTDYFQTKLSVLMKEWDYCQTNIGRYDTIIFGIRGWAVSAVTAILAVAVTQKFLVFAVFAIFPVIMFWLIDAVNRTTQRRFVVRAIAIELHFRSDDFRQDIEDCTFHKFKSPVSYERFIHRMSIIEQAAAVWREAKRNSVMVVYLSILMLCAACWVLLRLFLKS